MSVTREIVMNALLAQVGASPSFKYSSRQLVHWSDCPNQPAVFVIDPDEEYAPREVRGQPPKVTVYAEIWIYARNDGAVAGVGPTTILNPLIDAVEAALAPNIMSGTQTLGGLVSHCWIEGTIDKGSPGGGDALAVKIPVRILIPSWSP